MDFNEQNDLMELANTTSNAAKGMIDFLDRFLGINLINITIKRSISKIPDAVGEKISNDIKDGKGISEDDLIYLINFKKIVKEYKNCAKIVNKSLGKIDEHANYDTVNEDWFAFFFDKVKMVSEDSMQSVWGELLAGEINNPGRFQRSLMHKLSIMNSTMANDFCNVLRFSMFDYQYEDIMQPFIFVARNIEDYAASGITRDKLLDLESLGLVRCDFDKEFIFNERKHLRTGNKKITICGDPSNDNKIKVGNVNLTKDGQALATIVSRDVTHYRADILNYTVAKLIQRNCQVYINGKLAGE